MTRKRTAGFAAWRGRRALPRALREAGVGAVFAATGFAYGLVILARASMWSRFTPAQAVTAVLFGVLLIGLSVSARPGGDAGRGMFWRRFRAHRAAVAGLFVLLAVVAVVVLAPVVSGDPTDMGAGVRYAPPDAAHPMGTDRFGRDVWSRVAHGGAATLALCVLSVGLAVVIGILVGAVSGVARARVDDLLMRVVDGALAFPRILLLLTVVALASPGPVTLGCALAATGWMGIARIVRGEIRRMREREFVEAAIAAGVGRARLVWRHLMPNAVGHVIVAATLNAGTVILLESSLSFLGLGVQPPTPSWGMMVFEGRDMVRVAWWASAWPALAITLSVVALNLVGDGLRDAFETRTPLRSSRR